MYPRNFLCEKAKIKQHISSTKGSNMGIPIPMLFYSDRTETGGELRYIVLACASFPDFTRKIP